MTVPVPPLRTVALLLALASAALLGGALAFQYIGGLAPCVLCLWQRYPHVAVIVLGLLAALLGGRPAIALVALAAIALLVTAGIGGFHVGVERHWWPGTSECGSTFGPAQSLEELRARLLAQPVVRCDEIAWSLLGISMAGWNMLISLALAVATLTALAHAGRGGRR